MPGDAATPVLPDFTVQTATVYKTNIDAGFAVADRIAWAFAPREQSTPNMTVALELGSVFDGTTLTEVAAQDTGTITAPSSDPRIDRVVIDRDTGVVSVITGAEAASPTAPAITAGKVPVAQIALTTGTTEITNTDITDERDLRLLGIHGIAGDGLEADTNQSLRVNAPHDRKIDDYTALAADRGQLIEMDKVTAVTLNLTAAATLGEGWFVYVNNSGAGTLTIDPDSTETIDDVTTITLEQNQSTIIFCDGTSFWTVGRSAGPSKEFIVPIASEGGSTFPYVTFNGDFPHGSLASGETSRFVFFVPNDFVSLTDCAVMIIPNTTETVQWDVSTDFGADGESSTENSDSITDATEAVTINTIEELDVSGALTAIAAGDWVGLKFTSNTSTLHPTTLRFKYT